MSEPWQDALDAWVRAGRPGHDGPDPVGAYRGWTAERFGLPPGRALHLAEKWALDDGQTLQAEPPGERWQAGPLTFEVRARRGGGPLLLLTSPDRPVLRAALLALHPMEVRALAEAALARAPLPLPPTPEALRGGPDDREGFALLPTGTAWIVRRDADGASDPLEHDALLRVAERLAREVLAPWEGVAVGAARAGLARWLWGRGDAGGAPEGIGLLRRLYVDLLAALPGPPG